MARLKTPALLALVCLFFVTAGMPFVRRLGIEADEALIANGIYERGAPWYAWRLFGAEIPVMILTYLGALKTWLYNGLFALWPPGEVSLRLPMMLVGAVTIWVFFALLDRVAGRRAAWIGALLLATDASFLLTEAVDLGFVALQHLFKLGAVLLLLRFHQAGSPRALAAGFFLLGLALWDKAVFGWVLVGLGTATLAVFPREVWRHARPRNLTLAALAFVAGAAPFLIYNAVRPLETFRANAALAREPMSGKALLLRETMNGRALFGFLVAREPGPRPGEPQGFGKLAARLSDVAGQPSRNLTPWALGAAIMSLVALWRSPIRRAMRFALAYLAVTWGQMALTAGAGVACHHVILLWPFHFFLMAVALARAPVRPAAAVAAVLCAANLLVINQYYVELLRSGGALRWTDAVNSLSRYLERLPAERIFIVDWGILETLNLLSQGATPVQAGMMDDPQVLERMVSGPRHAFVAHTAGNEVLPEFRQRLEQFAQRAGFRKEMLQTIYDRNGRAIFDIFRFRPVGL